MTDAGIAKPRDGDVQDILAKPSTLIGEDQSRAAGSLLASRQYLHASVRQRNRQRPFLALLSFAARSGDGPHLGFEIDLRPIGQQSKYWALLNFRGGAAFATEVALTGRFFTAEEAFAAGLINRVAPEGRYLEVARKLAAEIAKNPPLSVRATVRTRRWYMEQIEREVIMQTAPLKLYLTEDFREAARAFAEKRQPGPFKGR